METFLAQFERELRLSPGTVTPATRLDAIPELDSLARVELLMLIQDRYHVHLEPQQLDACPTVEAVYTLVQSKCVPDGLAA